MRQILSPYSQISDSSMGDPNIGSISAYDDLQVKASATCWAER
jgi:hypothetical protein